MKKYLDRGFIVLAGLLIMALSGCKAMETAVDEIGDKAYSGLGIVSIIKGTPSDAAANGSPSVQSTQVFASFDSVPIKAKNNETLKDFVKIKRVRTPAWYDKSNVTDELEITITSKDNAEFQKVVGKIAEAMRFDEKAKTDEKPEE